MDGLDLEAAWRFYRACKQGARLPQFFIPDGPVDTQIAHGAAQRVVWQHRPAAQPLEKPVLHLAGSGFGIGKAKDVLRLDTGQKQTRDPVCQDSRLARPGIG